MTGAYLYLCKDCMGTKKRSLPVPPFPCRCGGKFRLMVQAVPQPEEQ